MPLLLLLLLLLTMADSLTLSLKVAPIQGFEPATVVIEAIIPPREDNRAACLVVDSESYYSTSCWELAGQEERSMHRKTFKNVPAGHYVAYLNVDVGKGEVKMVKREFMVQERL